MREDLLGYLIGAIEPAEREKVERALEENSQLRRELHEWDDCLQALRPTKEPFDPPPGLADRTCAMVADHAQRQKVTPARRHSDEPCVSRPRWSFADMVVALGVFAAASMLFLPAIAKSRFQARLTACQNNLRQAGIAMQQYSRHNGGSFPPVPQTGKLAAAGVYAPILHESGYVDDPGLFICPSSFVAQQSEPWRLPALADVAAAEGRQLVLLRRRMGGSYAYCLGYLVDGKYCSPRSLGRSYFPLLSDVPGCQTSGGRSANHGGCGQNVLFEDFHVRYINGCTFVAFGDDFFTNRHGLLEAGVDGDDAVLGRSDAAPFRKASSAR